MEQEALVTVFTNVAMAGVGLIALRAVPTAQMLAVVYIVSALVGALCAFMLLRKGVRFLGFDPVLLKPVIITAGSNLKDINRYMPYCILSILRYCLVSLFINLIKRISSK